MKKCTKCKQLKSLISFPKDSSRSDGLSYTCRECGHIESKKHYESDLENNRNIWRLRAQKRRKTAEYREYERIRSKKRREDLTYKISSNFSRRIRDSISTLKNGDHWESLVDYTLKDLIEHLQKGFLENMSWDNYGQYGWHIDHIIPVSWFDCSNEIEFKKCWALNNLQPKWAEDNWKKNNKYVG